VGIAGRGMKVGDVDEFMLSVILISTWSVVDIFNGIGQEKGLARLPPRFKFVRMSPIFNSIRE
jgi:hypothetical protein